MKEIRAVVRPNKLQSLRDALRAVPDFPGMTVTKVEGCSSPQRNRPQTIRDELTEYSPKVRIEIVCDDAVAQALYDVIVKVAATGHVGDGIVWMVDVARATFVHKTSGDGALS